MGKIFNILIPNIFQKEHDKILYKKILNYQKKKKMKKILKIQIILQKILIIAKKNYWFMEEQNKIFY